MKKQPATSKPLVISPGFKIVDDASLHHAVQQLREADSECISMMLEAAGPPPLRKREGGLDGLIRIIISQQVSTASADAIARRFTERYTNAPPQSLLMAADSELQSCGLSLPKISTIRHLCAAVSEGRLDFAALPDLDLAAARETLVAIKGIGPWTADVYFLFCLGHPHVWPAGDLALQEGVRLALGLRKRPDAARLETLSKRWRPWRAVAARIIWAYYGAERIRRMEDTRAVSKPSKSGKSKRA